MSSRAAFVRFFKPWEINYQDIEKISLNILIGAKNIFCGDQERITEAYQALNIQNSCA